MWCIYVFVFLVYGSGYDQCIFRVACYNASRVFFIFLLRFDLKVKYLHAYIHTVTSKHDLKYSGQII